MTKLLSGLKIFGVVIVVIFLFWLIQGYIASVKANNDLQVTVEKWQVKYNASIEAQKVSEETIAQLLIDNEKLQNELLTWQTNYSIIERKNKATQAKIKELEAENEEIRNLIATVIDDELWRQIFPNSTRYNSANNNSETGRAGDIPSTVSGY